MGHFSDTNLITDDFPIGFDNLFEVVSTARHTLPSEKPNVPQRRRTEVKPRLPPTKFSKLKRVDMDLTNSALTTSDPNIIVQWRQNDRLVSIEIEIDNVLRDKVMTTWDETSLKIEAENKFAVCYHIEIELAHPIMENFCTFKVFSEKLEVKVKKSTKDVTQPVNDHQWTSLFKNNSAL
jgi:hypothetical protein